MLQRVSLSGADAAWIQGRPYESLLSYIPRSEWTAVAARTCTTDLGPYIQNGIDAGKPLLVPAGTYPMSTVIKFRSGTALRAMGAPGSVIFTPLASAAGKNLIDPFDSSDGTGTYAQTNVLFEGLTFDGGAITAGTDQFMLRLFSVDGLTIRGCKFLNHKFGFLGIGGCRNVNIEGCEFTTWGVYPLSGTAGPIAVWLAGNPVGGDDTPTSRARVTNCCFHDGYGPAIGDYSTDSIVADCTIEDVTECGVYSERYNGGSASADNEALRHTISGCRINGVRRNAISAAGIEIAASGATITGCSITDTDDTGIKIYSKANDITVTGCHIWDVVKQQASYATYTDYGHITLINMASQDMAGITITGCRIGDSLVAPTARYAVTMTNLNGAGHYISALNVSYNNLSNGYTLSPFYEHQTPVSATDITSAICDNIGADDLYNPAVLNMRLAGRQLTTAYMLP